MAWDKETRMEYLKDKLYEYSRWYFPEYFTFDTPNFVIDYCEALDSGKNVYFKGFRWCTKTTIAQTHVNKCITNLTRRNIMRYSQTIDNAEENLTYIANSLIWWDDAEPSRLVNDFGQLYYSDWGYKWEKRIKRTAHFITENEVYVRAMSLWTSPRWKNFTAKDGKRRPDLIIFDDVDTIESVASTKKIDKYFDFMLNEVLGWTTGACQMIFLGNTIYEDWLVPRFEEHIKNDPNRIIINQPIRDEKWKIVWNRFVETDKQMLKRNKNIKDSNKKYTSLETERRRLWQISFDQNYNLIPYAQWQQIITRDMLRYFDYKEWERGFDYIQIGVDPAVSEKTGSDRFAITVTWFDWDKRYVLESVALEWKEKNIKRASKTVKSLYDKWKANKVIVEGTAYQAVLKTVFMDMKMAVESISPHRDKVTRLMEYQSMFEDGKIFFNTNGTKDLGDELLAMPWGKYDDMVDSMVYSIHGKKNKFFISAL